jgi:prolyl 4-hydroxylase
MSEDFIGKWYIKDLSICDGLINYHKENTEYKHIGNFGGSERFSPTDRKLTKDSIDVNFTQSSQNQFTQKYMIALYRCLHQYLINYPYNAVEDFTMTEAINIQHYLPGGGYKSWHCERINSSIPQVTRCLVFMTYLNDVEDGGETEFLYFDKSVKPKKGLTLIWPSDFTHLHRGVPSLTQDKYIVTGWFNYA